MNNLEILSKSSVNEQKILSPTRFPQNVTLPPISKVFPEHFGLQPAPPMNFRPQSSSAASQFLSGPVYPQNGTQPGQQKIFPPFLGNTQLKSVHFPQGHPPSQGHQSVPFRNNSINYYHNAFKPHGAAPGVYYQSPQVAMLQQQVDRKRSYHQQGADLHNHHSSSIIPSSSLKTVRSSAVHHPIKNLVDISNNGASTIQVKLHFRNFAMQLSSKATNLTSNQSGTAAADKEHFAAVMQDCVIATSVDFINSFPDYRPTVNNKLKPLKFIEFLQEQLYMHYAEPTGFINSIPSKDDLVFLYRVPENLLSKRSGMSKFKVFRHSRNLGIAIYRKGQRIFPVTPEDITDFWSEIPRNKPVPSVERSLNDLQDDDLVMICRGYVDNLEDEADSLAEDASKVPPGGDLDDILPPPGHVLDDLKGETATILAVIGTEFDEYMLQGAQFRVRHVIHVEKSGHTAIDEPWPYAITKHTLVLRPYLAMLYSDASKINRFSPTIEFVLKKAKAAPLGESILKYLSKLSEIQHMAAGMVVGNKLRFWATGGAFIIHLRRENPKSAEWIITFPGLNSWSMRELPVIPISEMQVEDGDCLLLCCPEIRLSWSESEIISVIKSRALWPEKFQILTNRLKEEKNSKNGIGFFEITTTPVNN